MRPAVLAAYVAMLPRLEAQAQLAAVRATAAGSGAMSKADHRAYMRDLRKQANNGKSGAAKKATAVDLAAMGITVEEV